MNDRADEILAPEYLGSPPRAAGELGLARPSSPPPRVGPRSFGRTLAGHLLVTAAAGWLTLATPAPARADRVDELSFMLEHDRDEKARIAAAVALGRLAHTRGVPGLIRALSDRSPVVRSVAATALGHIGDPRAIPALESALADARPAVRARVRSALAILRRRAAASTKERPLLGSRFVAPKERPALGATAYVAVKSVSNRASRGSRELAGQMRTLVSAALDSSPEITTDAGMRGRVRSQYVIDGSITQLQRTHSGPYVEVICQVKLTISTPDGRILSIVTGGGRVQTPRRQFRPDMERGLQNDALQGAVQGAYQNMVAFMGRSSVH